MDSRSRSSRSTASIARSARRKAFQARQDARRFRTVIIEGLEAESSGHSQPLLRVHHRAGAKRSSVTKKLVSGLPSQASPTRVDTVASEPPSTPIKRGLKLIYNNIPTFFSPRSLFTAPNMTPGTLDTNIALFSEVNEPAPAPALPGSTPDVRMNDEPEVNPVNSSGRASQSSPDGKPLADPITFDKLLQRGDAALTGAALTAHDKGMSKEVTPDNNSEKKRILKWLEDIEKAGFADTEARKTKVNKVKDLLDGEEYDKQKRAWEDQKLVEQEEHERLGAIGAAHPDRGANVYGPHHRFHPYRSRKRLPPGPKFAQYEDPLLAIYAEYEHQWKRIETYQIPSLTFETIPWPLLSVARTPADVTVVRVHEFMRFAKRGPHRLSFSQLIRAAEAEMCNWNQDNFSEVVLPFINDKAEAEVVRATACVVQEAFKQLINPRYQITFPSL